jgi:serine/threonine-protein kinase HipA
VTHNTPQTITLQLYTNHQWQDAATLALLEPHRGRNSPCRLQYLDTYQDQHLDEIMSTGAAALSLRHPLSFEVWPSHGWPAFLFDIAPAGDARRYWERALNLPAGRELDNDTLLLSQCTSAPVGHLRVKESLPNLDGQDQRFPCDALLQRDHDFLEWAQRHGIAIGGATGGGGDSPKLLLVEDHQGQLGIEALVPPDQIARHWFIKFPRRSTPGERALHAQILRAEAAYYRALARLGLDVIGPVALHESDRGDPSLWAPRFDRRDNAPVAVESLYSLVGSTQPGAQLNALQALRELTGLLREADLGDHAPALILEYLRRELLNLLLGNSDNHGRNLALLRGERPLRWAPIYDLAPMVMDPTGVTRATTWHDPLERGGQLRWRDICQALAPLARGINLWDELRAFAARLLPLPALLEDEGFPTEALHFPRVWVNTLKKTLQDWDLQ